MTLGSGMTQFEIASIDHFWSCLLYNFPAYLANTSTIVRGNPMNISLIWLEIGQVYYFSLEVNDLLKTLKQDEVF